MSSPTTSPIPHLRDTTRALTEHAWDAALGKDYHGAIDVLTERDRLRIAAVALEATGHPVTSPSPRARAQGSPNPEDPHPPSGYAADDAPWRAALLRHVHALAADPHSCGQEAVRSLLEAGVSESQLVAASQVACFAVYHARLVDAADMLDQVLASKPQPVHVAHEAPPPGDLEHPRVEFSIRNWTGWVRPAPDATAPDAPDDVKGASDYYGVLRHAPGFLQLRTDLYDEIMTGDGELDRADREFVALATSLATGCSFCVSVHGRRHFILSRDVVSTPLLKHHGIAALESPVQRGLAAVGAAIAISPVSLRPGHLAALLELGLRAEQIMDAIAVAAMFTWANRLMLTLGEGRVADRASAAPPCIPEPD